MQNLRFFAFNCLIYEPVKKYFAFSDALLDELSLFDRFSHLLTKSIRITAFQSVYEGVFCQVRAAVIEAISDRFQPFAANYLISDVPE
jgi:hypothetical protein